LPTLIRENNAMPTTIPDRAARARDRRRQLLAELTPVVAVMLYLLLLAWNMAAFETSFGAPRQGGYNPMEHCHRTTVWSSWPIDWLAQR
jgi:hypothetical protein